ncbi:MAG: biopolymer transporter ExbD [Dysgonamonadaceae bacterium]|jgi:biopolymer transport protein ExbD|nr:biopolymer transporter ExbD [Dysgonamonadaceae bacterium]
MSEIQVKEEGGGKNKQKKQQLRVDFTPMVDMNMLLITFFMFCTTLLTPKTMNITMPTKDETLDDKDKTKIKESMAITILLGANNEVYYYTGMIAEDKSSYTDPNFLTKSSYDADGLRKYLLGRNSEMYTVIEELKAKKDKQQITIEQYNQQTADIQKKAIQDTKAPQIMIKPTDLATYKNTVDALDEMLVCNIGSYTLSEINEGDTYLLYVKTGNPEYLSEKQKLELNANIK